MNPPSALHGAMSRERKPFTYTPGGLDLSEIKSERMAKRLMRNAMNQGVPELPTQQVQSPPANPIMVPNFNCLPVQVFPTINLPANPKSLLRTRSNPDPRDAPVQRVPPPQQNQLSKSSKQENPTPTYSSINNSSSYYSKPDNPASLYSTTNNNNTSYQKPISAFAPITNDNLSYQRPVSMFEYGNASRNANTLPRTSYDSNEQSSYLPEISYEAEYFQAAPRNVIKKSVPEFLYDKPIASTNSENLVLETKPKNANENDNLFQAPTSNGFGAVIAQLECKQDSKNLRSGNSSFAHLETKQENKINEGYKIPDLDIAVKAEIIDSNSNREIDTSGIVPNLDISLKTEAVDGNKENNVSETFDIPIKIDKAEIEDTKHNQNNIEESFNTEDIGQSENYTTADTQIDLDFSIQPISIARIPSPFEKPVEEESRSDDEQRVVKVVKKQVKKESNSEVQNGDQNGDQEAQLTVKLPTKKSAAKTETNVEVVKKHLPDGSIEEVKTTTTKTTVDGKTTISTKTETTIIPKEEEEEVEVEEEEEEEEENGVVEVVEENGDDEAVEEVVIVKKSPVVENGHKIVTQEERTETTVTKKVAVVQKQEPEVEEEEEEEEVEEEVVVKEETKPEKVESKTEVKEEQEVEEVEEEEVLEENVDVKQEEEEVEEEEVIEEKVETKNEEEEVEEEEIEEEKVQEVKTEPVKEEKTEEEAEEIEEKVEEKKVETSEPSKELEEEESEEEYESEKEEQPKNDEVPKPVEKDETETQEVETKEKEELKKEPEEEKEAKPEPQPVPKSEPSVPLREPSIPLEKVEDVEIKPIGAATETVTKSHTENTEIITNNERATGPLSTQTEYKRIENIVSVNRTTKTLDNSYEQLTQQGVPTVKTYFAPPNIDRISTSPLPSRPYQPVYPPTVDKPQERRHSLLLERLSLERQMPSDLIQNNYQYNNQTYEQQTQYSQEPQAEVLTVSNVKPSTITNSQWYQQQQHQQVKKENVLYNNVTSPATPAPSQLWNQPQPSPQPPSQPQYQPPLQPQYQPPQPQYQPPPQPQYQPTYTDNIAQDRNTNAYQQSTYQPYTPKPATWGPSADSLSSTYNTQQNQYSSLNQNTTESYQKSTQQYSSSYVPPPWEQDSSYVADVSSQPQNFYQPPPPSSTFNPGTNQGWKPTPPKNKFAKPPPTAYIPPAPNQSFVKSANAVEPPRVSQGKKTYYSEYERRYITVPESNYIPGESKYQPQPDPSPQYYYDNNEPAETVEPQWRKELREFTEKSSSVTTELTSVKPPWEEDPKYAKPPSNTITYTTTPTWSQTLRPRSWRERSFESEYVGSQEVSKTSTLGRGRPLSTYSNSVTPIPERARGVSVDRYNPNSYQPPVVAEHPPVQTHTLNVVPPAKSYHNPNVPAYHAQSRASAEPREQTIYPQARNWGESRASPIQSRSFKYLQWITGTDE